MRDETDRHDAQEGVGGNAEPGGRPFVELVHLDELAVGTMRLSSLGGRPVIVARTGEGVAVFEGRCPHAGFIFVDGPLDAGREIECPMHGARFDAVTGARVCGPGRGGLRRLEHEVAGGKVWVAAKDVG